MKRRPRLEIIPFIDVIFFLLATFMMVSLSMVQNRGIEVNLPAAQSASNSPDQTMPVISVDANGNVFWNQETISMEELQRRFQELYHRDPSAKLVLQGDRESDFGAIIEVMDEGRSAGLTKWVIRTQPRSSSGAMKK